MELVIMQKVQTASINTLKSLWMITLMLLAVITLVGLFKTYFTPKALALNQSEAQTIEWIINDK